MPTPTPGKQAVLRFEEETVPGTVNTDPVLKLFSPETQEIRIGLDKKAQKSWDVGEIHAHEIYSVQNGYEAGVKFHLYGLDDLFDFLAFVNAAPRAYTLEYIPNQDEGSPVYYRGIGWRPGTIEVSVADNGVYEVDIEFMGGYWVAPTTSAPAIGAGSRETKAAYDTRTSSAPLRHFSSAAVTLDGSPVATILNSFSVTFEHGVEAQYTIGNVNPIPEAATTSGQAIDGSVDISLDDGAKEHWERVDAFAEHEIKVPFSLVSASKILTFTGVKFPNLSFTSDIDTTLLHESVDYHAAAVDLTQVVP